MSFSEWIISRNLPYKRTAMVKLLSTTLISIDLAKYEIFRAKICNSGKVSISHTLDDLLLCMYLSDYFMSFILQMYSTIGFTVLPQNF